MEKPTSENLVELFFSKLKTSTNPGVVLAQFYGALMEVDIGKSEVIGFNRLIKIWGRNQVFLSIIDISKHEPFTDFPYAFFHKILSNRFERANNGEINSGSFQDLNKIIEQIEKEIPKVKKIDPEKSSRFLSEREG